MPCRYYFKQLHYSFVLSNKCKKFLKHLFLSHTAISIRAKLRVVFVKWKLKLDSETPKNFVLEICEEMEVSCLTYSLMASTRYRHNLGNQLQ